jgi:hypothetical protein
VCILFCCCVVCHLGDGCSSELLLAATARGRNLAGAHQVANVLLQELVVVIKLVVLFTDGFDAVKDRDERVLEGLGMSNLGQQRLMYQEFKKTNLLSSSRASLPSLSMSSLVRRGLMDLTSSGPYSASIGPTAELSRGTTRGPLLLRLGSLGRMGIGW